MDEGTPPEPEGSFVDYQTTMVKFSKAIAITAQEMVGGPLCEAVRVSSNRTDALQRRECVHADELCPLCDR